MNVGAAFHAALHQQRPADAIKANQAFRTGPGQSVSQPESGVRGSGLGVRATYVSDKLIISTISFKNCVRVGVSHK